MRKPAKEKLSGESFDSSLQPVLLSFEHGQFKLNESGMPVSVSPSMAVTALCELIVDCLLVLLEKFQQGWISPQISRDLKFLDSQKPDELGNSRSVKIGQIGLHRIEDPRWSNFAEDLLTEFLELESDILENRTPHAPPNIYEEDAQASLKEVLREVERQSDIIADRSTISNLCQKIEQLGQELHQRDEKIARLRKQLKEQAACLKQKKEKKIINGPKIHVSNHDRQLKSTHERRTKFDDDLIQFLLSQLRRR